MLKLLCDVMLFFPQNVVNCEQSKKNGCLRICGVRVKTFCAEILYLFVYNAR